MKFHRGVAPLMTQAEAFGIFLVEALPPIGNGTVRIAGVERVVRSVGPGGDVRRSAEVFPLGHDYDLAIRPSLSDIEVSFEVR